MTFAMSTTGVATASRRSPAAPWVPRALLLTAVAAGIAVGLSESRDAATADDLARLLRGMALIKAMLAAGATAAVLWRLRAPVTRHWFTGYAVAGAVMATGPGMIWGLSHVVEGTMLLHAGLAGTVVLLWRDPVVGKLLAATVTARRAARGMG